jgi:hypothetical protein
MYASRAGRIPETGSLPQRRTSGIPYARRLRRASALSVLFLAFLARLAAAAGLRGRGESVHELPSMYRQSARVVLSVLFCVLRTPLWGRSVR